MFTAQGSLYENGQLSESMPDFWLNFIVKTGCFL